MKKKREILIVKSNLSVCWFTEDLVNNAFVLSSQSEQASNPFKHAIREFWSLLVITLKELLKFNKRF